MDGTALTTMDSLAKAKQLVVSVRTVDEAKQIRDQAEAFRVYARTSKLGLELQNECTEVKLWAERRAGELLTDMERAKGRPDKVSPPVTLSELGISRMQSSRWQSIATLPEDQFRQVIETTKSAKKELTSSAFVKLAKQTSAQRPIIVPMSDEIEIVDSFDSLDGKQFSCIYADPPWKYGNQGTRAATDNHYQTMTVTEIAALPVQSVVAPNAHLHLWTTNAFIFEAKEIIEAWGFEYKSMMIWVKDELGIGNYWRVSHEILLFGIKGSLPFLDHSHRSWIQHERLKHSQKPFVFRKAIQEVSPGPYLELFGRQAVEGWTVFGNQVERSMFQNAG